MTPALFYLLFFACVYYCWFVLRARQGFVQLSTQPRSTSTPRVTVIVPARNEEENIGRCLSAFAGQTYPADLCEWIVVDDGSEDGTAAEVERFAATNGRIKLIRLGPNTLRNPGKKRGRKPEAIAAGVAVSTGEIILLTDADCQPAPTWVAAMVSYFTEGVAFVAGPVAEVRRPELFSRMRALDFFSHLVTSAGKIGMNTPVNANGANAAFRKSTLTATGGFDYGAVKSDEETLMHRIHRGGIGRVSFADSSGAMVTTFPPPDFGHFWRQRLRWGAMQGRYEDRSILVELSGVFLFFFVWCMALAGSLFDPLLLIPVCQTWILKCIVDYATLRSGARRLMVTFTLGEFLLTELFHMPYIVIVTTAAQFMSYDWKGRRVVKWQTPGR